MRILALYFAADVPADFEALAEGLFAFGPTLDLPKPGEEPVVLIDVTGCAGLFGKPMARGEAVLAHKALEHLHALGLDAHVALAEGPRLATMFAKLARRPVIVPKEHTLLALADVPLSLMPLSPAEIRYFVKLGLGVARDLMALPAASLGSRLERRAKKDRGSASRGVSSVDDLLLLLRGEDRAPLRAYVRKDPPAIDTELGYPTANTETLAFVLKSLCDSLWCSMQGLSLRKVSVTLRVDRGTRARDIAFTSSFAPALLNREDVVSALRSKLERTFHHAEGTLASDADLGEVQRVFLRFDETVPSVLANLSLYTSEARAARALPRLVAELSEGLGDERVGRLVVQDSWQTQQRSTLVPFAEWIASEPNALNVVEPTRLAPRRQLGPALEPLRLIVRLERDAWWLSEPGPKREIVVAWHDESAICAERAAGKSWLLGFFD